MTYDGNGSASAPWWPSRYGAEDVLGSANELTAEKTLRALSLPRTGRTIKLALETGAGIRGVGTRSWQQFLLAHESLPSTIAASGRNELSALEDFTTASSHIGCHLDGLGHVGIAGVLYNGVPMGDVYRPDRLTRYGIADVPPFVTRGVCLDVAAALGRHRLEGGCVIRTEDLTAACERQGVVLEPGDAVLLHTGWADLWLEDADRYATEEPGIGWDAAHWLTEQRPCLIGADNWGLEVYPGERPDAQFEVHQHVITESGTHILENIRTRELVDSGAHEFLFMLSAPVIRGATAAVASPVAVL